MLSCMHTYIDICVNMRTLPRPQSGPEGHVDNDHFLFPALWGHDSTELADHRCFQHSETQQQQGGECHHPSGDCTGVFVVAGTSKSLHELRRY